MFLLLIFRLSSLSWLSESYRKCDAGCSPRYIWFSGELDCICFVCKGDKPKSFSLDAGVGLFGHDKGMLNRGYCGEESVELGRRGGCWQVTNYQCRGTSIFGDPRSPLSFGHWRSFCRHFSLSVFEWSTKILRKICSWNTRWNKPGILLKKPTAAHSDLGN